MKKILVFLGGYLPGQKYGGPVTSIYNFTERFGDAYQIRIVCCDHDFGETQRYAGIQPGWNRVGKAEVTYLPDAACNRSTFRSILLAEKPDLIYASGIMHFRFNAPVILEANKLQIPVLLAPRGDICQNALRIKAWKKRPFLFLMKKTGFFSKCYFQATMQEEADNLVKYLGIDPQRIWCLPNLPSAPVPRIKYRKESGVLKIVFVSRIQSKKNLLAAIQAVCHMREKAIFDIYGPIENQEYWKECQEAIRKAPEQVRISYRGALRPQQAKEIYANYDCFLFPTFSENYGHVIAEALLHDCPILISKGTTPWDDVEENGAGYAVSLQEPEGFTRRLDEMATMDNESYACVVEAVRKYVAQKVKWDDLKAQYENMFRLSGLD